MVTNRMPKIDVSKSGESSMRCSPRSQERRQSCGITAKVLALTSPASEST